MTETAKFFRRHLRMSTENTDRAAKLICDKVDVVGWLPACAPGGPLSELTREERNHVVFIVLADRQLLQTVRNALADKRLARRLGDIERMAAQRQVNDARPAP